MIKNNFIEKKKLKENRGLILHLFEFWQEEFLLIYRSQII